MTQQDWIGLVTCEVCFCAVYGHRLLQHLERHAQDH